MLFIGQRKVDIGAMTFSQVTFEMRCGQNLLTEYGLPLNLRSRLNKDHKEKYTLVVKVIVI